MDFQPSAFGVLLPRFARPRVEHGHCAGKGQRRRAGIIPAQLVGKQHKFLVPALHVRRANARRAAAQANRAPFAAQRPRGAHNLQPLLRVCTERGQRRLVVFQRVVQQHGLVALLCHGQRAVFRHSQLQKLLVRQIVKLDLPFIQRAHLLHRQAVARAQHGHTRLIHAVGIQRAGAGDERSNLPIVRPPDVVRARVRWAIHLHGTRQLVIERVRDDEIAAAHKQPVQIPAHIVHVERPHFPVRPAAAEAFVQVTARAGIPRRVRRTLCLRALRAAQRQIVFRRDPAPHDVLPRNAEAFQQLDVLRPVRVAAQSDSV